MLNHKHVVAAALGGLVIGGLGPAAFGSPPSGFTPTIWSERTATRRSS